MKINIKDNIQKFGNFIKEIFNNYPLTISMIFLYTIFSALLLDETFISEEVLRKIYVFGIFSIIGVFFVENIISEKIKRIIGYLISAGGAIGFTIYLTSKNVEFNWIARLAICYVLVLLISSFYILIKKSKKDFSEYILKVLINGFKTSFVYCVISLGVLIVYEIFDLLILDNSVKVNIIGRIEILILGFYYLPKIIYAFLNMEDDIEKFFSGLLKYVLIPLVTIAFVIIYLYIFKIIVLQDIPKNQIYRILTALFVLGGVIWTCAQYLKDDSFSYKISLKLPLAFIPFIFLQMYSIGVRIYSNGITPNRYICVAFIIFEILYSLFYLIKKERLADIFILTEIIIIVSVFIPFINMFDISALSQSKILKELNNKIELEDSEKEKIQGAYKYLKYSPYGKKYIEEILTEDDKNKIESYIINNYNDNYSYEDFNYNCCKSVNISKYNNLIPITTSGYRQGNKKKMMEKIDFSNKNTYEIILNDIDLSEYYNEFIEIYKNNGKDKAIEYFDENNVFKIDDNSEIIIMDFNLNYDKEQDYIYYFNASGYYLTK